MTTTKFSQPVPANAGGAEPVASQLAEAFLKLPRRVEPIGGQRCSYVALDDVIALCEQAEVVLAPSSAEGLRAEVEWLMKERDEALGEVSMMQERINQLAYSGQSEDEYLERAKAAEAKLAALAPEGQNAEASLRAFAESFSFTVTDSFYNDAYLKISEPNSVNFKLGSGSQFSKFIAALEERRRAALGAKP